MSVETFSSVPSEAKNYFWHNGQQAQGFWSIIKPLGKAPTNLATNPSFELDTAGWFDAGGAVLTRDQTYGYHGIYSGKVVTPAGGSVFYDFISTGNYLSTNDYCASVYVRADSSSVGAKATFAINRSVPPGSLVPSGEQQTITLTTEWQKLCVCLRAGPPPVFPFLPINITFDKAGTYYVDQLGVFTQLHNRCLEPFNGDNFGAFWNGTPHASTSTVSKFASHYGERIYFHDIGFDIYSDSGWGMPPIDNLTTDYARGDGAHYLRTRAQPRVITLSGVWQSCSRSTDIHRKRQDFFDAITYRFSEQCAADLLLCYQMFDNCGNAISNEMILPVVYTAGLEGARSNLYDVRAAVQFTSHEFIFWTVPDQSGLTLTPNATTVVPYGGDSDARPTFRYYNTSGAAVKVESIVNTTTGHGIYFGTTAAPGISIAAGESLQFIVSERNFTATKNPGNTDVKANVDFTRSSVRLFRLVPGDNNIVVTATPGNGEFSLRWNNRYKSIDSIRILESCGDCAQ